MDRHRLIIGTILTFIGVIFVLILIRIYGRFDSVEVRLWQQAVYTIMTGMAILQMGTGLSLMLNRPWPIKLNIFVAAFNLVVFPIGTFAGAYYFWYMYKVYNTQRQQRMTPGQVNSDT
jgi:hypothetical protein